MMSIRPIFTGDLGFLDGRSAAIDADDCVRTAGLEGAQRLGVDAVPLLEPWGM
jgi:hypothetical protein